MIYELRKYVPRPGRAQALKNRFAHVTLPIFERLGIWVLYCFEDPAEPDAMYYLTAFASVEARDAAWHSFAADSEWKKAKAASEIDGPLLASQNTVELRPAAFSPSRE